MNNKRELKIEWFHVALLIQSLLLRKLPVRRKVVGVVLEHLNYSRNSTKTNTVEM